MNIRSYDNAYYDFVPGLYVTIIRIMADGIIQCRYNFFLQSHFTFSETSVILIHRRSFVYFVLDNFLNGSFNTILFVKRYNTEIS